MEVFGQVIGAVYDLFQIEFTIYGFTFSFWSVFVFSVVGSIVAFIIREVMGSGR